MTEDGSFKASTTRVLDAARAAGLEVSVRRFPEDTRTATDAARAIGCPVAAIVKSLVFLDDDGPALVLVSGANQADVVRVAALLDAGPVRRADAAAVRAATGFAIGGVAPLGHPAPLRLLMDADLLALEQVWAAAGTPDTVFAVSPSALRDATGATVAEVAEAAPTGPENPPRTEADRLTHPGEG